MGGVSDYFVTPIPAITQFLTEFRKHESAWPKSILDPCAGGDTDHPMSYPTALRSFYPTVPVTSLDIRDDSLAEYKADYLKWPKPTAAHYDMIITNPPFNLALDILQKALYDIDEGGFVIVLLRLNFFGSQKRRPFFEVHMPKYTFVHSKRMSFFGGTQDSIEYMHGVWQKGHHPTFTKLKIV